jgi:hypothetical protein
MCDFCNKPKQKSSLIKPPEHKNDSLADNFDAVIKGNVLHFEYDAYSTDSSFSEEVKINFCPMCGKALKTN